MMKRKHYSKRTHYSKQTQCSSHSKGTLAPRPLLKKLLTPCLLTPCLLVLLLTLLASCHNPSPDRAGQEHPANSCAPSSHPHELPAHPHELPAQSSDLPAQSRDSLEALAAHQYPLNANLQLVSDSLQLACLPVKDCFLTLYQGDRVVVAEVALLPGQQADSLWWVKVAKDEVIQGWISEADMKQHFVPTDSISQAIYFFSRTHAAYFIAICALFIVVWLFRALSKRPLMLVYFNDINSFYPLLLCLLMSLSATLYETMQRFAPHVWEQYYYNPTLSPFHLPPVLSLFLSTLWLFIVVLLAAIDESFRQLAPGAACCYLLGLAACCICCYLFFILTTTCYVGYLLLPLMAWLFWRKARVSWRATRYRCGKCGHVIPHRGICPHCGTRNE